MNSGVVLKRLKMPVGFILVLYSVMAQADRPWPIITFTCDPSKNEVKLKNEVKWGESGKNFAFNAEQGTYNPWELIAYEDRSKRKVLSQKTELNLSCKLGAVNYRFVIRPKIFNPNIEGKCGDRLSVVVTVYKGETIILMDKPMESFCFGNAPVLRGIKVKGGSNKVKLYKVPRSRFY